MIFSRLSVALALLNVRDAARIQEDDSHEMLSIDKTTDDTLETYTSTLVDGLTGEAVLDLTEIARSIAATGFQELAQTPMALCAAAGRRCAPIFRADLHTAHSSFSWEPGHQFDAELARIGQHGLVVGNVALLRSVDGIFTNEDAQYFSNPHGLWYSVLSTFGCQSSTGTLRASRDCQEDEQLRWYVFVGTRGTQGATEVMANFGLYEDIATGQFLNAWERARFGQSLSGGFVSSELINLLANLTNPDLNVTEMEAAGPWWNIAGREEHILPETIDKLAGSGDTRQGLQQLVHDVRSWAASTRELVTNDARDLVEALHTLYVPGHSTSALHLPNRDLFCDNSWLGDAISSGTPGCPVANADASTTFVFTGHSFGGVAAQLQGVVAQTNEEVQVAAVAVNAPGVHHLSKHLDLRNARHSWRNDVHDWWNTTFGATHLLPISRVQTDEIQDYSRFLLLVAQHDVLWKIDRPLSKVGQTVCMFYHPPSQSHCANYTDLGLFVSPSCEDNSRSRLEPHCESFSSCIMTEHFFQWEGAGGTGLNGLRNKPLDTGSILTDMIGATGNSFYNPTHPGMTRSQFSEYKAGHDSITAEFEERLAPSTSLRNANLTQLLSRYEESTVKIWDLDDHHCCDFTNGTCNRLHNGTVRLPCEGENMHCSRIHTGFGNFVNHAFKNKCGCQNGWHYSLEHAACVIEDSSPQEEALAAWYANQVWEAEWIRDGEIFHLNQDTQFGTLDDNFGGEGGKWRCSLPGDDSWHHGMLGSAGQVIFSR